MGEEKNLQNFLLSKKGTITLATLALVLSIGSIAYAVKVTQQPAPETQTTTPVAPAIQAVSSLGRLEPQTEVIKLAAPPNLGGSKITQLLVKEGDQLQPDQIVAILDSNITQQAATERAAKEVKVAEANLAIVKAGAKTGEKTAQQETINRLQAQLQGETQSQTATIDRLQAELDNAQTEYQRYQKLAQDGAISASELDQRSLSKQTAEKRLKEAQANLETTVNTLSNEIREAQANLDRISEVRDVDVQQAQAELEKAQAAYKEAQAQLELTTVRSPIQARVLKINARPGESVDQAEGIIEIGETEPMMVVAEIYESDIAKVKLGQQAVITSESRAFEGEIKGQVSEVGWTIGKKDVLNTDPAADVDSRVVEVKILLTPEDSRRVAQLTYSKVFVKILL